ncbi:hypothetical protein GCM10027048_40280 [Hymenobacter coalescens]
MKHVAKLFHQLAGAALVVAALSGCSRGEYAMLPKTSPYHATYTAAKPAVQPVAPEATPAPAATAEAPEVTPAAAPAVASAPVAQPSKAVVAPEAKPARKLNPMQQVLVKKMAHKVDKLAAKAQLKKHQNTAGTEQTQAVGGNLRLGIIFLAIGLILALFAGVNGIFGVLGTIAVIIGIVLLVLWLLEQA